MLFVCVLFLDKKKSTKTIIDEHTRHAQRQLFPPSFFQAHLPAPPAESRLSYVSVTRCQRSVCTESKFMTRNIHTRLVFGINHYARTHSLSLFVLTRCQAGFRHMKPGIATVVVFSSLSLHAIISTESTDRPLRLIPTDWKAKSKQRRGVAVDEALQAGRATKRSTRPLEGPAHAPPPLPPRGPRALPQTPKPTTTTIRSGLKDPAKTDGENYG